MGPLFIKTQHVMDQQKSSGEQHHTRQLIMPTCSGIEIRSPLMRVRILLSSITEFMLSIHTASTGPSNMIHFSSGFSSDVNSIIIIINIIMIIIMIIIVSFHTSFYHCFILPHHCIINGKPSQVMHLCNLNF